MVNLNSRCLSFQLLLCGLAISYSVKSQPPTTEVQIKFALLAAPESLRADATVMGYNSKEELIVIRQGSNDLTCLTDDPKQKGFNASCYHKTLEPFMTRGRELKAQGKSFQEIFDIREKEVKEGKLIMPVAPATLYVYSAADDQANRATGEVTNGYLRYVIYIPYATAASTGLPLTPSSPGMPWIMDPGTHRAHIMINPAP